MTSEVASAESELNASAIQRLFSKAKERRAIDYLYVLVRIDGIQCFEGYKDKLISLRDSLAHPPTSSKAEYYRLLASEDEPLGLIQNLLNCVNNKDYQVSPFIHLKRGAFPNAVWPTTREKVASLAATATASGFPELASQITSSYRPELLESDAPVADAIDSALHCLAELLGQLLESYFAERLKFNKKPKYAKLPGTLDVLEFITDPEFGLSGLRVHFSQNCVAEFQRTPKGVFGMNFEFGPPVTFLMMSVAPGSNEYRVNGKRLYEIDLRGRYNELGQWKPLIYPGDASHLIKECKELSEDPDVQGALLYLRLTGHRRVEFVLRTNIELPETYTGTTEGKLHIWKCPVSDRETSNRNLRLYDCWLDLETGSVEEIQRGLSAIAYFVSVLCFPFGAVYSWRVKYRMAEVLSGVLTPSHDDLKVVDRILKTVPESQDGNVLASGIDWYNRGSIATNVFSSFLCFYIALESVAVAIADGADLGASRVPKPTRPERKALTISCINAKHAELFESDPIKFVRTSYFECVEGLATKVKSAISAVFGADHQYFNLLFKQSSEGDMSLSKLRSELAHGDVTLLDKEHEKLVRKHVYEMGRITREFLLRILFCLNSSEEVPKWSGQFQQRFVTADPRSTLVSSTASIFPTGTDWTIRDEWCE